MLRLEPRAQPSKIMLYGAPVCAVALTLLGGVILFAAMGTAPLPALYAFFIAPIDNFYGVSELGVKGTPLLLCAIGLAIGFRANIWNIGAEGQLVMGAICGGGVGLFLPDVLGPFTLLVMFLMGALGGLLWAAIPAFLKLHFNANEILTSLMLTYVAQLLLAYLVRGPWRDPHGFNFPQSKTFEGHAVIEPLIAGTRLGWGVLIALAVVLGGWFLVSRTFLGFQIKVMGMTPMAALYAGFNQRRLTWFVLLLSGALAGIAGLNEAAGPVGQLLPSISPGYGFTAVIVAFLGRLHPIGILLASLLVALSYIGGESAQISLGLPVAVTGVFQGMLLFFLLASEVFVRYRIRWARRVAEAHS